jgi:hypothetical protein
MLSSVFHKAQVVGVFGFLVWLDDASCAAGGVPSFHPYIASDSGIGEIPLLLWFLIVGVNDQRGKETGLGRSSVPLDMKCGRISRNLKSSKIVL